MAKYFISIFPAIIVICGNLTGDWWVLGNALFNLLVMVSVDRFSKPDLSENHVKGNGASNFLLLLHVALNTLAIGSLIYGIHEGIITSYFIFFAAISTGFNSGISGLITAHELIHRKEAIFRAVGIWNLILVNYGHFYIEHVRVHHKYVGTPRDPATARLGESIYAFIIRTIPQQFISAFQTEKERHSFFRNFVVQVSLVQIVLILVLGKFFGIWVALAYIYQGHIAVLLLEYTNYIEHYGLVRDENSKVTAAHAWQTDVKLTRASLFELSRHSDHHIKASKPYQTLVSHEDSPVLPHGYYGVFYQVLIPSLWFKLTHPILKVKSEK